MFDIFVNKGDQWIL